MAAVAYGHVAIVPKGIWNAETQYEVCQLVEYDGSSYVAKAQPPVGTLPTDTLYWQVSAAGTKKASSGSLGTVMPDGSTTEVNEAGKLSAKTAQQDAVGVVKGSNDITVGEDGNLTVNTEFEQATELANLIAGEAIKSVLGKVSKAIAATMNLDQNALLKNMISGIDVNSGEKVPSSAFVHTLYERLGMGTDLSAGDAENVTQAVNALYSNFYMIDDATEHIESVYSLFRNNISVWGAFKNLTYHFRIGGNADSTFGNGHFSAYIMRDAAGAVYTAIIISKWLGDVWSMIFTTYDDVKIIKKLS